jgi:hypothetical protein
MVKLLSSPLLGLICGHVSRLQIAVSSTEPISSCFTTRFQWISSSFGRSLLGSVLVISLCFPQAQGMLLQEANQDAEMQREKTETYKRFVIASGTQR